MPKAKAIRRIGILTGGGDCPGINAVIRAITKTAIYRYGLLVMGIEDGFEGLVENRVGHLSSLHVSGILSRGGTILGTNNRCDPAHHFIGLDHDGEPMFVDAVDKCIDTIRRHEMDALVVIGGDGTMSCAAPFIRRGITCIGVPKTIDNDIVGTDLTFGFLTAAATAAEALDRLHSTAASHHRVMVCELMGRNAGWLTLHAGVASGTDVILIPEIPFDLEAICRFVKGRMHRGRGFSMVACAEGARPAGGEAVVAIHDPTRPDPVRLGGVGAVVAGAIAGETGIETRTIVLGHVQRGGPPIAVDRVLATELGHHAVEMLMGGASGRMVAWRDGALADADMLLAADRQRLVPRGHPLIAAARGVKTCFGDE